MSLPPMPKLDAFHRARSKIIDAFIVFESALVQRLDQGKISKQGNSLGLKLKCVSKLAAGSGLTDEAIGRIKEVADRCLPLVAVRNDLVHSQLQLVFLDGIQCVCLINANQPRTGNDTARIVSLPYLQHLAKLMLVEADKLRQA